MNKDQIKGKAKDVAGRVQRQVGEWTDDPKKQAEGAARQVEGKVQNAWGNAKEAAKKASDKVKPATDQGKRPSQPADADDETAEVRRGR